MTIVGQGEFRLLSLIKKFLAPNATADDAAVIADATGFLVLSTDMYVQDVHFTLRTDAKSVGWRSLALALGDLAAKGAQPMWALTSLALPKIGWGQKDLIGVYRGMRDLGSRYGMSIVGGDLSSTEGPIVLSITVIGRTERMPLSRAQAQPGWSVGVTGRLGRAAIALRERRAWLFDPLIEEGRRLNELGLCCGDISDGLVREMEKFAEMSGVGCELDAKSVPRAPRATIEDALTSGEEPELVCVGPENVIALAGLHLVGRLIEGPRVSVLGVDLKRTGYDHFGRAGN